MSSSYIEQLTSKQASIRFSHEIGTAIKTGVEEIIGKEKAYDHDRAQELMNEVVDRCMTRLTSINSQRKYIVSCTLTQNLGLGMHSASGCYWDNTSDATYTHKLETPAMVCICTVYGVKI
eukprot:NODE_3813_length_631_cov_129.321306_g2744_i0.p3 GENE.NODE_3813_length_631_cov_129.321306_g2744_i0~~NODE_3813_length_631_cov_129.321306_g2744_i0.p3  ORF type:complete len:120 (+),score=34.32 NODE_3813_length_631_cov_129.321306_g2744_i0:53-412(+)